MKKDLVFAVAAAVVVAAICFGLAAMKPPFTPRPSHPYTLDVGMKPGAPSAAPNQHIIMRVNGEPITEEEFQASFAQLPEEMQRQFASEQGKQAFAEQMIRLKLLEQEGRRMGVDNDPHVAAQLAADRTNIIASAAAMKLVGAPTNEAVQKFYTDNKQHFQTVELSHILVAYAGGAVPARTGNALPQQDAMKKALMIRQQLAAGADFAQMALKYSDDQSSADRGGALGPFGPGMLPPEIEQRVFSLKPGEITQPIPSRYGIHIFKAGARTTQPLDQVRPGIARRVQQQNTLDRVEVLRKSAKVDFDSKFFPLANEKPPAQKRPS